MHSPYQHIEQLITDKLIQIRDSDQPRDDLARLPTIKEIAKELQVRDHIIRQIYQRLSAEGRITTTRGRGTYIVIPKDNRVSKYQRFGINIDMDRANPQEVWRARIYDAILSSSVERPESIVLGGFNASSIDQGLDDFDGFILFYSSTQDDLLQKIRKQAESTKKPWVCVDPPGVMATENFVSANFFEDGLAVGRAFKASGRRNIVMMTNHALDDSVSDRLRFHGLVEGLGLGNSMDAKVCRVKSDWVSVQSGSEAIANHVADHGYPDAIYTTGDFLALGCIRHLSKSGLKAGQDFSIIGGTGVDLSSSEHPNLTRTKQPFHDLGQAVIDMLLAQIHQKMPMPGRYLDVAYIGGDTTTPEENAVLKPTME